MPHLTHPYDDLTGGAWLAGTLHAHGPKTGGHREPQAVLDDYAARGYGFVMIAEHNVYTLAADYAGLDTRGMILLPGSELTDTGPHLLHVGADAPLAPDQNIQRVLDAAAAQPGRGIVVAAHPNWGAGFDHIPVESMLGWNGLRGLEIYNGLIQHLDGSAYALDKWDRLLSAGRRVWGFADDDSFVPPDVQQGWNVAYVKERSVAGVVDALRAGRFYASSGVRIESIQVEGRRVRIATDTAHKIVGVTRHGRRFIEREGPVLDTDVPADLPFARFECWGAGERFAWTQPFWTDAAGQSSSSSAAPMR
jgi:hypothetical protein